MITRTSERRSTVSKRKKKGEREREEKQSRHGRHKHIVKRETNALVNTPSARLLFSSRKERANFSNSSKSSSSSSPPPSRRKKKKRTPAVLISRSSVEPLLSARARPRFPSSRVKKNDERNLKKRKKTKQAKLPKEKKEKKRKIWSVSFLLHLVVSSLYFIHSFLTHHTLREYTTT